jgi:hypothetical protein
MMSSASANRSDVRFWTVLLFLGGIDGFKLLEPLRELGARPFFLIYLVAIGTLAARRRVRLDLASLRNLLAIVAVSTLGFALFGSTLPAFGDKTPATQFGAHALLFLIGFSPLCLRLTRPLDESALMRAAFAALALHGLFVAIDGFALLADVPRPFESSFLGAVDRPFPTGLFSEPSYLAAYVGVLLPVCLYRSRAWVIGLWSVVAGLLFFLGDVRSFFIVYTAGMFALVLVRWGLTWKVVLAGALTLVLVAVIAAALSLLSVEESLSSAYRFGNAISYFDYAVDHDVLIGHGFGSAHFLYPSLDFPDFMYLSTEFTDMLDGGAGNRVPVFNLWVRLFVEIGILPTLFLLGWMARRFMSGKVSKVGMVFVMPTIVFSLSTDSYIYGMFTLALMLMFSLPMRRQPVPRTAPRLVSRDIVPARNTSTPRLNPSST